MDSMCRSGGLKKSTTPTTTFGFQTISRGLSFSCHGKVSLPIKRILLQLELKEGLFVDCFELSDGESPLTLDCWRILDPAQSPCRECSVLYRR